MNVYNLNKSAFFPLQHPVNEWCRYMRRTRTRRGGVSRHHPPPRNMKSYLIKMLILFIKHGNCGPGLDKYVY